VATLGLSCGSSDDPLEPEEEFSLAGEWTRINSSFGQLDGMVIRVNSAQTQAAIVSTPANIYMFQVDDVKWRNIVKVEDGEYQFEDLVREANTGAQSHVPGVITVNADDVSLSISFPTTGTFQDWLRAENGGAAAAVTRPAG
jgi:hypothetical protein